MGSAASNSPALAYGADASAVGRVPSLPSLQTLWDAPGTWALTDQAVLSLGNFLTQLVLARNLSAADYGTFVLVYGVLLFLNTLHGAVVTYPLSVRGAVAPGAELRRLAGAGLVFTALLAPAMGLLLAGGAAGAAHRQGLSAASLLPWALAAMVLWQAQETLRRAIMARLEYRRALPGDAVGYLGQAAVLLALAAAHALSLRTAFGAVAVTSAAAAMLQFVQVRPRLAKSAGRDELRQLAREFWRLGRWVLLTCGLGLVTVYAMPWTLFLSHGPAEVAAFQALANVLAVGNPIVVGINNVVVPGVAQAYAQGFGPARALALRYGLLGALLLAPLYAALAIAPHLILSAVYGARSPYADLTLPLRLFVVAYALVYPAQMAAGLLYGLGKSRRAFRGQGAFAAATLAVSLPAAARFGLWGAVWAGLLPPVVYVAANFYFVRRLRHAPALPAPGQDTPGSAPQVTTRIPPPTNDNRRTTGAALAIDGGRAP